MNSPQTIQPPNYYEVLGADPLATLDDIEGLFRQLATEADSSGDHSHVPQAIEAFKVLRDPDLREQYDQQLGSTLEVQKGVLEVEVKQDSALETEVEKYCADEPTDDATIGKSSFEEELKFSPDLLAVHRRELLKMFYEKKRKNMRKSGIAIGGLDSLVPYSYELLEFHLWVLAEKQYVIREESGALSISASGSESHEQNLLDGLVQPGQ